jgi:hypothetical protein
LGERLCQRKWSPLLLKAFPYEKETIAMLFGMHPSESYRNNEVKTEKMSKIGREVRE